ncbi:MAG: tRNA 4-thiouridine(8) synthase ThiI [Acidobacteria bacterium]|nr:tRNA 4-thiouridine(8) synthase ThiI [Acidobacteriota bacterium]
MPSIVVHYQEIALKGRNRPWFVSHLVRNIRQATRDLDVASVRALMGRIEIEVRSDAMTAEVSDRLRRVFGIANFSVARRAALDLDEMAAAILRDLEGVETGSFRVSARRADKRFPLTSPQIEREVGGRIKVARGWRVDLTHPELKVSLEILPDQAFYSFEKQRGPGGLPTGGSGRVACLLSGGIDSPVAAFRVMKRGCSVLLVHFHSYPLLSRASQEKVRQIAAILTRYQLRSKLALVGFGEIQRRVVLTVPSPLRVVMYRRLMMRIAQQLARKGHAKALVTGEVIGQVASQTIENLSVIGRATELPVLRPLIGMDKEEIVAEAQRLGTYEISIIPDQDCCQLFTPPHPATKARAADVEAAESQLPIVELVEAAVAAVEWEEFSFPILRTPTMPLTNLTHSRNDEVPGQ